MDTISTARAFDLTAAFDLCHNLRLEVLVQQGRTKDKIRKVSLQMIDAHIKLVVDYLDFCRVLEVLDVQE